MLGVYQNSRYLGVCVCAGGGGWYCKNRGGLEPFVELKALTKTVIPYRFVFDIIKCHVWF